jgi:hypothetical protein
VPHDKAAPIQSRWCLGIQARLVLSSANAWWWPFSTVPLKLNVRSASVKSCQALLVSPLGPAASMECLGDIEHPSQNVRIADRTLSRSHLTGDPAEKHEAADFCAELR